MDRNRHSRQFYNQFNHRGALGESRHHRDSTFQEVDSSERDRIRSSSSTRTSQSGQIRDSRTRRSASSALSVQDPSQPDYAPAPPISSQRLQSPLGSSQFEHPQLSFRNGRNSVSSSQLGYGSAAPSFTFNISTGYPSVQPTTPDNLSNQFEGQLYYGSGTFQPPGPMGLQGVSSQGQALPQVNLDDFQRHGEISGFDGGVSYQASDFAILPPQFDTNQQQSSPPVDARDRYGVYEQLLRRTNTHTLAGRLREARVTLLELATWLTDNVEPLGLTQDGPVNDNWREEYSRRLSFWEDVNNCWLAFLTRQHNDTRSKGRPKNHNLLSTEMLDELGEEVVRISDRLEEFALVDYQMGFHERELIPLIRQCIKALETNGDHRRHSRRE